MKREQEINLMLQPFIECMHDASPRERIWILEQVNQLFCVQCGCDEPECCPCVHESTMN